MYICTYVSMHVNSLEWSFVSKYSKLEKLTHNHYHLHHVNINIRNRTKCQRHTNTQTPISPLQKQIHWQHTAEGLGRMGCGRCPE